MITIFTTVVLAASAASSPSQRTRIEASRSYLVCMAFAAGRYDDGTTDVHIVQRAAAPECEVLVEPYWQAALREEPRLAGHEVEWKAFTTEGDGIRVILYARAAAKKRY